VFLATGGKKRDLLTAITTARAQAQTMVTIGRGVATEYEAGTHDFQQDVHIRQFTYDYLTAWARLTNDWADRTEKEVNKWNDLKPTKQKQGRAIERIKRFASERL
jgi:hypothetical protein